MTISTLPPDRIIAPSPLRHEPRFQIEARADDFDLTSGLRLIRRRIAMILAVVALLMAAAATVISGLKPTYHGETRLMIHRPLATMLSAEDSDRNDPMDLTSETERLLSRSVAERVIRELRLAERPEFNPALRQASLITKARGKLRGLIDRQKPSAPIRNSVEPIILEYYGALHVSRDGSSDVIRIGFDASDPELAAAAPNRLTSIYLQERNNSIRGRLDAAEGWFRQRIAEQQDRANAAHDAAEKYQKTASVASSNEDESEPNRLIVGLSDRKLKIEESRAEVKATISTLKDSGDVSSAIQNIAAPESIAAMVRDLREKERDLAGLLEVYVDDAATVVAMRAAILKSRADLGIAVDRYLQSMRDKLAALDVEGAAVGSALAAAQEQQSRSTLARANLERLQRIAENEQTALDRLEEQRRALAGQAMLPAAEVEVLSPAAVPLEPQGRGRLFYLIGALLASFSIAVTAAFVVEMLDNSIRSFDQMTGMPRIIPAGFIPRLRRKGRGNTRTSIGGVQVEMLSETIRTAMISLKQSNGGKLPGSIVVTSAHGGEGKSFVAKALAIELVANGSPVLLVDSDLRRRDLGSFFEPESKPGLNEFLSGRAGIQDVIHHHRESGVDFIPAGLPSVHPGAHLAGMTEIIEVARARGQIVIFDSAPVLTSTDTMHLAALAERTLMVVQWAKTSRRAFEFSVQQLKRSAHAELLVIINSVEPEKHALYSFSDSELFVKPLTQGHRFGWWPPRWR